MTPPGPSRPLGAGGGAPTAGGAGLALAGSPPYLPAMTQARRPSRALAAALLASTVPAAALAADASPWARGTQSQARLVDGGRAPSGGLLAGLEIRLQPHFITYWRDPGDAGVPPTFSFAGSTNLKSATVRYPAPRSIDEAGDKAFGYEDAVTFPILVEPSDPSKPVGLAVTLDYAACHDVCLPAHADLKLALDGQPSPEATRVREALSDVPRPGTVGGGGAPAVRSVVPGPDGGFTVTTSGTGRDGSLFVEAPEGWAYAAGAPDVAGGAAVFPVKRLDHPKGAETPPAPVILTLTAPTGAVEVSVTLDGTAPRP